METKRIWLVDASTYIFRAYFSTARPGGPPIMRTTDGLPTNAVRVFTQMLRRLMRRHNPDYAAIVFDRPEPSFRKELFPDYKANRSEPPEDLVPQFPFFRPIAEALGLPCVDYVGFEADDIIATLVHQAKRAGWEAVIVSSDKDLYQLLFDGIHMLDEPKQRWIDQQIVLDRFGVSPDKVVEVQGLMGDSVDNIPGVPGVGPKRASHLIQKYGSLEGVYQHIDEVKGKLRENLENHKDAAYKSRTLASLRLDVPITMQLDEYRVRDYHHDMLEHLCNTLQFKGLYNALVATQPDIRDMPHTVLGASKPAAEPATAAESTPTPEPAETAATDSPPQEEPEVVSVGTKSVEQMAFDFSSRSNTRGSR